MKPLEEIAIKVSQSFENTRNPISPQKALAIFDLFVKGIINYFFEQKDFRDGVKPRGITLHRLGMFYCKPKRRTVTDKETGEKRIEVYKSLKWKTSLHTAKEFRVQEIQHDMELNFDDLHRLPKNNEN